MSLAEFISKHHTFFILCAFAFGGGYVARIVVSFIWSRVDAFLWDRAERRYHAEKRRCP